jgi:hypothetical protein
MAAADETGAPPDEEVVRSCTRLTHDGKIGVGVGVGIGIVLWVASGLLLARRLQRKKEILPPSPFTKCD